MKPAPFAYVAPTTVNEVVQHLAEHGSEASVLAGGQSLVRLMNQREAKPAVLIDINRVVGTNRIEVADGSVRIGATVRQRDSELSPDIGKHVPLFAAAGGWVAHPSVRARGTVVGSVCFADPSAELPTALLAMDGEVLALGPAGERVLSADDFFTGACTNALADDEFAVAVQLPDTPPRTGSAFLELSRRHGELPVCAVAALLTLDDAGDVVTARIALGSVAERPVRAREAEAELAGASPTPDAFRDAAATAAGQLDPFSNCHGDATFRTHLAAVLTERALSAALDNLEGDKVDA